MPYANPEDKKKNRKEYRDSGRALEMQNKWIAKNRDRVNQYRRDYWVRLKNDPKRYKKHIESRADYRRRDREKLLEYYGGTCACCGEDKFEFLGFDHKKGGGCKERKGRSSSVFIASLRKGRKDIQVLCHNCNLAKGFYGKCPHKRSK